MASNPFTFNMLTQFDDKTGVSEFVFVLKAIKTKIKCVFNDNKLHCCKYND